MKKIAVISQNYISGPEEEYVIVGNDALMKCKIPSFVSDFVSVVSWLDSEGSDFYSEKNYGKQNKTEQKFCTKLFDGKGHHVTLIFCYHLSKI